MTMLQQRFRGEMRQRTIILAGPEAIHISPHGQALLPYLELLEWGSTHMRADGENLPEAPAP